MTQKDNELPPEETTTAILERFVDVCEKLENDAPDDRKEAYGLAIVAAEVILIRWEGITKESYEYGYQHSQSLFLELMRGALKSFFDGNLDVDTIKQQFPDGPFLLEKDVDILQKEFQKVLKALDNKGIVLTDTKQHIADADWVRYVRTNLRNETREKQ